MKSEAVFNTTPIPTFPLRGKEYFWSAEKKISPPPQGEG